MGSYESDGRCRSQADALLRASVTAVSRTPEPFLNAQ